MASTPILGCIFIFGGNFAPRGYALCQGQVMSIQQNAALFSLLGTTYGGNGTTTFALPDLRGRSPIGTGTGPGLSPIIEGQAGGANTASILVANMPAHSHALNASTTTASQALPTNNLLASVQDSQGGQAVAYVPAPGNAIMSPTAIGPTGGSQPLSVQNPYLGINYIIATQGIFPSRN
ncbi:MAG TPA: tail fiber protein [Bryobacteraceae bacterium]|jgi:microcystin-dependent protein